MSAGDGLVIRDSDGWPMRGSVLLSVQRALFGAVSPSLRGVTFGWQDHLICLRFYLDGPMSEEDQEAMSIVGAEVIADLNEPWIIDVELVRRDTPEPMECLEAWAYLSRE
jgi:hypothetical protein